MRYEPDRLVLQANPPGVDRSCTGVPSTEALSTAVAAGRTGIRTQSSSKTSMARSTRTVPAARGSVAGTVMETRALPRANPAGAGRGRRDGSRAASTREL